MVAPDARTQATPAIDMRENRAATRAAKARTARENVVWRIQSGSK